MNHNIQNYVAANVSFAQQSFPVAAEVTKWIPRSITLINLILALAPRSQRQPAPLPSPRPTRLELVGNQRKQFASAKARRAERAGEIE